MIRHVDRAGAAAPAAIVPAWTPATITPRGAAVLAILRAQDLVRQLDTVDREYVAPYAADLLVDLATDILERP